MKGFFLKYHKTPIIAMQGLTNNPQEHSTPEQAATLLYVFNSVYPISKNSQTFLIENTYPITVKKGKKLHKAGEICDMIYFVNKGAIRGYVKEEKKDITTWITVENELVASIHSFILQIPSFENMEAIEDSELLRMSHKDLHHLYDIEPQFNIMARRIYEKYYADAEIRALIARLSKAEKKYEYFLKTYSHLSTRIPLKYIASFLGINLETLSRVRGLIRNFTENKV
ncbi:Crp/Fnr family transcriptional regulator [Flavobacterium sp. LS1R49]|uniref:Crp/Fnr family transcriptional regulator n=1 Tax=Flavobacterium shii TaxID=2987687 RepID=A0A9X2ZDP5_9FLAO|nr:Crp/Fnr family transcriptional regulator [Flavobacterium shii]MCV9927862.1 Crp/Fnr family transcriptional regulator [Flavobacterium shii]